jgi:hypothetical protein
MKTMTCNALSPALPLINAADRVLQAHHLVDSEHKGCPPDTW